MVQTVRERIQNACTKQNTLFGIVVLAFAFFFYQSAVHYYYTYAQYSNYGSAASSSAAVSTDVYTTRKCYDMYQREITSVNADPATYYHENGDWVAFDVTKGAVIEDGKIGIGTKYVMYWRPSPKAEVDQTVYIIGQGFSDKNGFANYGSSGYCTGWLATVFPSQKEMRCWSNRALNFAFWSWANADGVRGLPADPGTHLSLEPDITCSGISPSEWKWLKPLKPVEPTVPAETNIPAGVEMQNPVDGQQSKKIPLIQMLKKKKK